MKTIQAMISNLPARSCLIAALAVAAGFLGRDPLSGWQAWAAETTKRIMITPPTHTRGLFSTLTPLWPV